MLSAAGHLNQSSMGSYLTPPPPDCFLFVLISILTVYISVLIVILIIFLELFGKIQVWHEKVTKSLF